MMRSLISVVLLLVLASVCGGLAYLQWKHGNLEVLLDAPAVPLGDRLYPDLNAAAVMSIQVKSATRSATFERRPNGWYATAPWEDRMAPEAAIAIIQFTAGLTCEDYTDRDDVDFQKLGLGENRIQIRLLDDSSASMAHYRIGHPSSWMVEVPDVEQPVATVFVQKLERHHKQQVYIGSGDISPLFKEDFRFLRDHQPFYFHPAQLKAIRIRGDEGELTLGRKDPASPWKIVKPLELSTDPAAMKGLLEGLVSLRANRLAEKAEETMAATDAPTKNRQVELEMFGMEGGTTLEIYPPGTPEAREVVATVSDRLETVFHLSAKPEPGITTLANLPLSVNELRDPLLTHLHVPLLKGISIQPSTAPEVLLGRNGKQPWMVSVDGREQPANEEKLYALLQAVTNTRAVSFESDAVTDFAPFGLDRPILVLRFLGTNNQALELRFGLNGDGDLFANRLGSATVMRIQESFLKAVAIHAYEWKSSWPWSFQRFDLKEITRQQETENLRLEYSDVDESWRAWDGEKEVSAELNTRRAEFLLTTLEGLRVDRWLARDDTDAAAALVNPMLRFRIIRTKVDDDGEWLSIDPEVFEFSPHPGAGSGLYYGRRRADPHPFVISRDAYEKLTIDLLE